jgi:Mce-associated membrane protein
VTEPEKEPRQERVWLAAGALIGVIVAGILVTVGLLLSSDDGSPPPAAPVSPTSQPATVSAADPASSIGNARDESLKAAEQAVVVLNTLDYRIAAQEGLDRWESVATGALLEELRAKRAETSSTVSKAKTSTTAKVLAAAASRVAQDGSSADILVSVEVTVTDARGTPTVKQVREKLTMTRTGDGWKVGAISTVEPAG